MSTTLNLSIIFTGRVAGSLGIDPEVKMRVRKVALPSPFTIKEAKEAGRRALYEREGDDCAYENVAVKEVIYVRTGSDG